MKKRWMLGLLIALLTALLLSPFASPNPDGLETAAAELGFAQRAENLHSALLANYLFPGVAHEGLATSLAGGSGVLLTFAALYGLGKLLVSKRKG